MIAQRRAQLDIPSGTMLGKFEIIRKLAMGGMAEIYLARVRGTAGFEKLVVVKRILPTVAEDPAFVRMFLEEARLAAALHHPNIGDVYEVGDHEGTPFFAMEYIQGQDVRSIKANAHKRNDHVPMAIALAIVHGTASALDYAHERVGANGHNLGIVHRDVSLSNILVSYDGAIKLIDFGIARAAMRSGEQTQTGTLKGKIPYMSPEQCRGQAIDRRSDLFSLGVVMYELTVGHRPFRGESDFEVMDAIVHHGPRRPAEVMRGYPVELDAIVMKLLARLPEERYQTAEELSHDLDPFLAQHQLWVSPKALARYMRTVFADAVSVDEVFDEGVTRARIPSSPPPPSEVSGPSGPSVFPGIARLSQEMPTAAPKRPWRLLVFGLTAIAAAGAGFFYMVQNQESPPSAVAPTQPPAPKPAAEPAPAPPPPRPEPPADEEIEIDASPRAEPTPPPADVKKPPPIVRPKKTAPITPVAPIKQTEPEPPKPPPPPDKPKDDKKWDLDSPLLPP